MLPEDRLDALLAPQGALPQPYAGLSDEDAAFGPLLAAAAQLAPLAEARPTATFAQTLENRFLARAALLADADIATHRGYNAPMLADAPTRPSAARSTRQRQTPQPRGIALLRSRYPRLLPQAIAASLVLILGVGTLTAAAAAWPGGFLFPLHRIEQGIQLSLSGSAADRFRLHLGYASDALTALDAVHGTSGRDKSAYAQALATLGDEERAAEKELAAVPSGTEHDGLAAQLQSLKTRATHDLYIALSPSAALSWQNRVATTQVLGQLGAQVPHIDAVRISRVDDTSRAGDGSGSSRDTHSWKVMISGTGFTPGAVVVVNGNVAGTVTQFSPTHIVALVKSDDPGVLTAAIGIEEADGTAAQTSKTTRGEDEHSGVPGATATPATHSGDGHSGDGHGGNGSGPGGTLTPTPTPRAGT